MAAARELVAEQGPEALNLREVARRLGVSHQAPYKHFPTREHLLAELMRRGWHALAEELERERDRGRADLRGLARRYLAHAEAHPHEYRLLFETRLPEPAAHPALAAESARVFGLLGQLLHDGEGAPRRPRAERDLEALFVWAAMHGVLSMLASDVMPALGVSQAVTRKARGHVLAMLARALRPER